MIDQSLWLLDKRGYSIPSGISYKWIQAWGFNNTSLNIVKLREDSHSKIGCSLKNAWCWIFCHEILSLWYTREISCDLKYSLFCPANRNYKLFAKSIAITSQITHIYRNITSSSNQPYNKYLDLSLSSFDCAFTLLKYIMMDPMWFAPSSLMSFKPKHLDSINSILLQSRCKDHTHPTHHWITRNCVKWYVTFSLP